MVINSLIGFSEPFSSMSHLLTAFAALLGSYVLCYRGRGNIRRVVALVIFSFSLIFLFSMSGVYHLLTPDGAARHVLKHLDHSAIWILIAGTFTPIQTILFRGRLRWGGLLLVWGFAIIGLVLKIIFFNDLPEWLWLLFYLSLGWLGVAVGLRLRSQFDSTWFHWLWLGGIAYSIGAILDFIRWPIIIDGIIGSHEIFHIFIILGALSHWIFIYKWSSHPVEDTMTFHVKIFPDNRHVALSIGDSVMVEAESLEILQSDLKNELKTKYHKNISPIVILNYIKVEILK